MITIPSACAPDSNGVMTFTNTGLDMTTPYTWRISQKCRGERATSRLLRLPYPKPIILFFYIWNRIVPTGWSSERRP